MRVSCWGIVIASHFDRTMSCYQRFCRPGRGGGGVAGSKMVMRDGRTFTRYDTQHKRGRGPAQEACTLKVFNFSASGTSNGVLGAGQGSLLIILLYHVHRQNLWDRNQS